MSGCVTPEQRAHLSQTMREWHRNRAERELLRVKPGHRSPVNRGLLVPHAKSKCAGCGNTLVVDPLPHWCIPSERSHTRAIDPTWGYGG